MISTLKFPMTAEGFTWPAVSPNIYKKDYVDSKRYPPTLLAPCLCRAASILPLNWRSDTTKAYSQLTSSCRKYFLYGVPCICVVDHPRSHFETSLRLVLCNGGTSPPDPQHHSASCRNQTASRYPMIPLSIDPLTRTTCYPAFPFGTSIAFQGIAWPLCARSALLGSLFQSDPPRIANSSGIL